MRHVHTFTRSKPTAGIETCPCGAFRHTEHSGPAIVAVEATIDAHDGESGAHLLTMPEAAMQACSASGAVDEAVAYWVGRVTWIANDLTLRRALSGYGAWADLQTADLDVIKARVLWTCACNEREERREREREGVICTCSECGAFTRTTKIDTAGRCGLCRKAMCPQCDEPFDREDGQTGEHGDLCPVCQDNADLDASRGD